MPAEPFLYDRHKFNTRRGEKESEMSTNRFLVIVIAVALAALAALTFREGIATRAVANNARPAHLISIVTTDYWARHPELSQPAVRQADLSGTLVGPLISIVATDYWARHPELSQPAVRQADLTKTLAAPLITIVSTDYWARHPELMQPAAWQAEIAGSGYFANHSPKSITSVSTDYWARHPELRQPAGP
jgi:hypothetical protein